MDHRPNRPPTPVLLLAAAQVLLSLSYAVLMPTFQGSDETQHVDMAVAVAEWEQWPEVGDRLLSRQVRDAQRVFGFRRMGSPRAAEDAPPRAERPSLEDLEAPRPTAGTNHINQHPPLFYSVENAWTGFVVALSPVDLSAADRTVLAMRALGAVFGGIVLLVVWWTAVAAGLRRRTALAATVVPLAVPMFTHVQGSVSNDTLLNLSIAGLTLLLVGVVRGDLSVRRMVLVGAVAGVAMFTKLFGLLAAPMVLAAALWSGRRWPERLRFALGAGVVAFFAGGWWWLRNLVVEGRLQPAGLSYNRIPDSSPDIVTFLRQADVRLWQGFFGRFGNLIAPIPRWLLVALTVLVLGGLLVAATRLIRRRPPFDVVVVRRVSLLAAMPFAFILMADVARVSFRYVTMGRIGGLQGRYAFLGIVGVALLVALGVTRVLPGRGGLAVLAAAALVAQPVGAFTILRQFWGERGADVGTSIAALAAWAPFAGWWTAALFGVTFVVFVAALVAVLRADRDTAGAPDGGTAA